MSPSPEPEDSDKERTAVSRGKDGKRVSSSLTKGPAKRRTKTGCLTCRKRRIKCDEEKPFCKNCVKSKRECAGYIQPLVYKQHHYSGFPIPQDGHDGHPVHHHESFSFNETIDPSLSHGRPPQNYFNPFGSYPHHPAAGDGETSALLPSSQQYTAPPPSQPHLTASPIPFDEQSRRQSFNQPNHYLAYGGEGYGVGQRQAPGWASNQYLAHSPQPAIPHYSDISPASNLTSSYDTYPPSTAKYFPSDATHLHDASPRRYSVHGFVQASPLATVVPTLSGPRVTPGSTPDDFDRLWDGDSSDHSDYEGAPGQITDQRLSEMVDRNKEGSAKFTKPSIQAEAFAALQAAYQPANISPLGDERNERIFCHFVEVTSSCMSIFERAPDFTFQQPRTLWNFFVPSAAISHPALAHAILALGGLHIAKLRNMSEDPSLKHFTYALRRVGKLLGLPNRRHEIATLATVLLLGFYEVLAADHSRWSLHLEGAKKLIMEIDFATTTRMARRMRNRARQRLHQYQLQYGAKGIDLAQVAGIPLPLHNDEDWEVDQEIVSVLTGLHIDYDRQRQPNYPEDYARPDLTEKDVMDYKTKMDLRWWYCKQDIFRGMISGDPPLMPYEWWILCPPRGRIGNAHIPYASFDHLLLLLARLTNFGGKDRQRKIRMAAAQRPQADQAGRTEHTSRTSRTGAGDRSVPTAGPSESPSQAPMGKTTKADHEAKKRQASTPYANEGRPRQAKPAGLPALSFQGGPPMHGMMPPPPATESVNMHSSFRAMEHAIGDKAYALPQLEVRTDVPSTNLEEDTAKALAEYAAIKQAFDTFVSALGPDFQPVDPDKASFQTSPFGSPLRYRSPEIACIWLHYNVGQILLHRLHPHMPAAAMIAAGLTAQQTNENAENVGKICAGIFQSIPDDPGNPLDPRLAGALLETTIPLLFSGVQYQEMSKRGWTISKLHDIARMTGWQTSATIAAACEHAWETQGRIGRGPLYHRSLDRKNKDARINGLPRLEDTGLARVEVVDAASEHESKFVSHDRNLIGKHGSTRVHWALGLLGVETDMEKLRLGSM
ncbi:hypothetical protein DV736_g679, partial [Chaetothyriales sp. CBS 134916]